MGPKSDLCQQTASLSLYKLEQNIQMVKAGLLLAEARQGFSLSWKEMTGLLKRKKDLLGQITGKVETET